MQQLIKNPLDMFKMLRKYRRLQCIIPTVIEESRFQGAATSMYDTKKVAQAAAVLFRAEGHTVMPYLRLIKLLYLADRESFQETGMQITGDRLVAMKHGPVLSNTYNHIMGRSVDAATWQQFIKTHKLCPNAELVCDPGDDELSKYEVRKLQEIANKYRHLSKWKLRDLTHKLPEWEKNNPGKSSRPISRQDLFAALGRTDADETERQEREFEQFSAALRSLSA